MSQQNDYSNRTNNLEEELKLARERFNVIFQNTTVSIWDYIFETKQIIQPTRSQELHGFDTVVENVPDSLIESGFIHPDSAQEFREMYHKLFAGAKRAEGIFRVQTADRTGYWYEHIRYHTLFDEEGKPYAAVGMSTDDTDEIILQQKVDSDNLTGLLNKAAFKERMKSVFSRSPEQSHILLNLDIDDFKQLNDRYGHVTGDELLRRIAKVIDKQNHTLSKTTFAGRAGGDEFFVLLCDTKPSSAISYAQTLLDALREPLIDGISVTCSIGIAVYPKDGETGERLELAADRALYSVKRQNKNGYCFYGDHKADSVLQVQRRQQFLSDTMSGGMVGGYIEPGFPIYFVDEALLAYLGYDNEEEYVSDLNGLVENGIHTEDREFVQAELNRQLSFGNRYMVDYRMKKKDGSYIWVHDVGEKMISPDGRPAITSVCTDISAEKERDNLLTNLLDGLEAKVGLYRVEKECVLKLLHASKDIMDITHYSDEEYRQLCREDAVNFVYAPDREQVRKAVCQSIEENKVVTENFRLLDKQEGYTWVSGVISKLGDDNGLPAVRIIFMPLSLQNELQLQMLDSKYIGVYVIDKETDELYYANDACLQMHGVEEIEIIGRPCYEVFQQKESPCEHCWKNREKAEEELLEVKNDRVLSIEVQETIWNNRNVAVIYSRDVTEQYRLQKQQQALFDNIPAGLGLISIKDGKFTPIFFSSAIENLLGIDTENILSEDGNSNFDMFQCVHPDDLPRLMSQMEADRKSTKNNLYYKYRCWNKKQEEYRWIELHANTLQNGDETLVYATYTDMTKANHVQKELEKNQSAMDTIINYASLGVWSYDLDTKELKQEYSQRPAYGSAPYQANVPESYIKQGNVYREDAEIYQACYDRILAGEPTSDCIVRVYDFDASKYLWMHIYLIRQKDTMDGKRRALGFSLIMDKEIQTIRTLEETQTALRQSQEMLETACTFAGIYIVSYNISTKTAYIGEVVQKEFNLPARIENFPEEIEKYPVMLPDYIQSHRATFDALHAGAKEVEMEFEARFSSGEIHWLRLKGHVIDGPGDSRIAVISSQSIDVEKAMSAKLIQEREKLQSKDKRLLHYYVADLTRSVLVEYKSVFMDEPVLDEKPIEDYFRACGAHIAFASDYDRVMKLHNRSRLLENYAKGITQEEYDTQLISPERLILWSKCTMSLLKDPVTGDILLYEYVYDMSEEEILTTMLQRNIDYGYEMIGHWIVKSDQLTFLEAQTRTGESSLKYMLFSDYAREFVEKHIHPEDKEIYSSYRKRLIEMQEHADEKYTDALYRTVEGDGSVRYHKAEAYFFDKEKGICLLTRRDYTDVIEKEAAEKKQLMDALAEAKRANEAKNDFMARMSHDMRTPMNAILGMTHLAGEEEGNPARTREYIDQIEESSRYLLGVINDILEMGRIESGKAELSNKWYAIEEILEPVIRMIEPLVEKKHIEFESNKEELKNFPIEFYVDKQKTQQMLMNLLNNACKFTPEGGRIKLRFSNALLDRANGNSIDKIVIEDTGCGMTPEFLAHIFEPFEQERLPGLEGIPGTGLGLAIARNIARQMGGDITVESQLGQGSKFTITYPHLYRHRGQLKSDVVKVPEKEKDFSKIFAGKHVLLAEDNNINAKIAVKILEKKGLIVKTAAHGQEALDLFQNAPAGTYDLILMDIRMPIMDGLEATRKIRESNHPDGRSIPIIAMSANAYEEDRQLSLEAGMDEHLSKPVEPEKLYSTIEQYMKPHLKQEKEGL